MHFGIIILAFEELPKILLNAKFLKFLVLLNDCPVIRRTTSACFALDEAFQTHFLEPKIQIIFVRAKNDEQKGRKSQVVDQLIIIVHDLINMKDIV